MYVSLVAKKQCKLMKILYLEAMNSRKIWRGFRWFGLNFLFSHLLTRDRWRRNFDQEVHVQSWWCQKVYDWIYNPGSSSSNIGKIHIVLIFDNIGLLENSIERISTSICLEKSRQQMSLHKPSSILFQYISPFSASV